MHFVTWDAAGKFDSALRSLKRKSSDPSQVRAPKSKPAPKQAPKEKAKPKVKAKPRKSAAK